MKRVLSLFLLVVLLVSVILIVKPGIVQADSNPPKYWCGNGSETDNYGFTYDLTQPHWTIGNGYVSEDTMNAVDVILDKLNADQLAQTMILVLPEDQVGIPVNCAVHFLRYMQLGLVDGPHADNGFTFLFIVGDGKIDVHYGVGLGLPALTAQNLGPLNRLAEDTYASTHSLDMAILETVKAYDTYVRSEYTVSTPTTAAPVTSQPIVSTPSSGSAIGLSALCCSGLAVILVLVGIALIINRRKKNNSDSTFSNYEPTYIPTTHDNSPAPRHTESSYDSPSFPSTPVHHSSPSSYSSPSFSRPSSSSSTFHSSPSRPSTPSRGGSGSGRSGRGG